MLTCSLLIFFFSKVGLGRQCISRTLRASSLYRTPVNMTLCWNFYVTYILAYSWRHYMTIIPIGTILDTLTRLSDGCSGLSLFRSQLTCQALHKREVFSACGYELYFWCALCSSGTCFSMKQSSGARSKWTLDHSVHDDNVTLYTTITCVTFFWTTLSSVLVARGRDQQRSLDCFAQANDRRQLFISKECTPG